MKYSTGQFLLPTAVVFIVIMCPLLVDTSEVYCVGGCNNDGERNQLYEDICCNPDNLGDVVRLPSTENSFKQRYIYCPSTLPTGCGKSRSCADILSHNPSAVSGYYNITLNNGSSVSVYCDMEGANCNGEGGWTRVAYINPNESCPYGLSSSNYSGKSYCIEHVKYSESVISLIMEFSTFDIEYSQVCGEVHGFVHWFYLNNMHFTTDNSQQHIWTFAIGNNENGTSSSDCPCNNGSQGGSTELFNETYVGNDYYCENQDADSWFNDLFWDGKGCYGRESTCCTNPMMPWFVKTLNELTTDNIKWKAYHHKYGYWNYFGYFNYYIISLELMIK